MALRANPRDEVHVFECPTHGTFYVTAPRTCPMQMVCPDCRIVKVLSTPTTSAPIFITTLVCHCQNFAASHQDYFSLPASYDPVRRLELFLLTQIAEVLGNIPVSLYVRKCLAEPVTEIHITGFDHPVMVEVPEIDIECLPRREMYAAVGAAVIEAIRDELDLDEGEDDEE